MTSLGKTTTDLQIKKFIEQHNFSDAAKRLIKIQKDTWETLSSNYSSLQRIKTKIIRYDGFSFVIQFNPGRYVSSSAMVDEKSINNRKCFLCLENLPEDQEGLIIKDYILLANPYPIFPEHFTISNLKHRNQRIKDSFGDLLFFSRILSKYYTIFYNGPHCGASAPDHLHFQAGSKNVMPLDSEFVHLKDNFGEILSEIDNCNVHAINDQLRKIISIEGDDESIIRNVFGLFYNEYSSGSTAVEPLMNIICSYNEDTGWRVNIILRARHRPKEYFLEGEERIIFSPAACDYGGLCITPMEKDFNRFDGTLLHNIFAETSINDIKFRVLVEGLKAKL
jgi:hypothetical protein